MANEGAAGGDDDTGADPLNFRPNPDALVSKVEEDAEEGEGAGGVYRPPKMLPTAMEDFEEGGKSAKEKRKEKEARRRASRSALIKVSASVMLFFVVRVFPFGFVTSPALCHVWPISRHRYSSRSNSVRHSLPQPPFHGG